MFAPKGSAFAPTPEVLPIINSDVGSTSRRGVWELFSVIGCGAGGRQSSSCSEQKVDGSAGAAAVVS
jgi:hypothetical protein